MKLNKNFLLMDCDTIADLFVLSGKNGYDSDNFCEQVLTSEYGIDVITGKKDREYYDYHYMLEGFEINLKLKRGASYDADVLWFAGYLYKFWVTFRGGEPKQIWKIAPISLINRQYGFYHTQGFDYVIDNLIDRYKTSKG